jgi:membrane-associated protease RseP (regulator of RpoE activity)
MNITIPLPSARMSAKFLAIIITMTLLAGCASEKTKPVSQRGWIGGEYVLAKPSGFLQSISQSPGTVGGLPQTVQKTQKAAVLITELNTNAPAQIAGLRKGDLILELNHQPVTQLAKFRKLIDRSQPGTVLAVKAFRDGKSAEYNVPVGQEQFRNGGLFTVVVPTVVHQWDLWPNPGFSLVVLGYEPNPGTRHELGNKKEVYDEDWKAYLVFFEVSDGKRVVSQEPFMVSTSNVPASSPLF